MSNDRNLIEHLLSYPYYNGFTYYFIVLISCLWVEVYDLIYVCPFKWVEDSKTIFKYGYTFK